MPPGSLLIGARPNGCIIVKLARRGLYQAGKDKELMRQLDQTLARSATDSDSGQ